jgi:hypothetical protein
MVFKLLNQYWVLNLNEILVILRHQAYLKEYDCVLVAVTHKTLIFLAYSPSHSCIHLKETLLGKMIYQHILIPNQLWAINLPCQHKLIMLAVFLVPHAIFIFALKLQFIIADQFTFFALKQPVFIVNFAVFYLLFV